MMNLARIQAGVPHYTHVAVRPSVLDTVKQYSFFFFLSLALSTRAVLIAHLLTPAQHLLLAQCLMPLCKPYATVLISLHSKLTNTDQTI